MRPDSDAAFARAARGVALGFQDRAARLGMGPDETANLALAALVEVVAGQLGDPFRAVERLRDAADAFEAQFLAGGGKRSAPGA